MSELQKKPQALQLPSGEYLFSLSNYEPVDITFPKQTVTKMEVDRHLEELVLQTAETKVIEPRQARLGDIVVFKLVTTKDGEVLEEMSNENFGLELGLGTMPHIFEDAITELSPGESASVEYESPIFGMVKSEITLHEIRERVIPALNDIWVAKNFKEAKTVPELADLVEKQLVLRKRTQLEQQLPFRVADELAARLEQEIPEEMYEQGYADFKNNFEAMLMMQGLTREKFMELNEIDEQTMLEQERLEARRAVEQGAALLALAKELKIEVADEEIPALLGIQNEHSEEFIEAIKKDGTYNEAKTSALKNKALKEFSAKAHVAFEGDE
ncbi:MAG: hypothetical protein Q4E22_05720 [Coriobacteriia bacterium]|nr:hypothetical protein [Coriobacteriia bacterium]